MADDPRKDSQGTKPRRPESDDTEAVEPVTSPAPDAPADLPPAEQGPPSLQDLAVDVTLPGVRQAPPGVEDMAVDATLPVAPKEPPVPGDLGVTATLPVTAAPPSLKNVGLRVSIGKSVAGTEPATPPDSPVAPPPVDADSLGETLEIYAPEQAQDPLAKMLGVADGLVNPDAGPAADKDRSDSAETDAEAVAKAAYAQRYELREEVGRGGIGRVVLAFDPRLGREVALKELLPRFTSGKSVGVGTTPGGTASRSPAEVRFLDEARVTAQLEHPGIVPVYELGQRADGSVFYAMRMVRGKDMKQALKGRSLRERLELIPHYLELCHAMAYAHSRGVVHRDLKPDNVMLGEFGETVVLDWGLAKVRGKKDRRMEVLVDEMEQLKKATGTKTVMGAPLGTPSYMPPEQAGGMLELIDERSDVYSLGAILYEILTGRPPHVGESALAVLKRVRTEDVVPPLRHEADAPPELSDICLRALASSPEDRYDSAQSLAEDVRRFQVGGLVRAHDYSLWELTRRWLRRHRTALAVVAALLAVAGTMWWYRGYADARRQARAERARKARVQKQVDRLLTSVAAGPKAQNWLDVYTFKLIALREPLVEKRLVRALAHPKVAVRRLAARSLGGMKSRRAVEPLCARLGPGVEPSETVVIAVINALGIIGDSRANTPVSKARFRHGQFGGVWRKTELAFRMIPLPPLPKSGVTANLLVDRGRDTHNKGDRDGALALYSRAIQLDPKLGRAYNNRAIVRKELRDLDGALADYAKAIEINPGDIAAYNNRAYLYRRQGKYARALADLARVVASKEHRVLGLQARALVYRSMGRVDDALRDYRTALPLQPDRASIPYNMSFLWLDKGDAQSAIGALTRALKAQPGYTKALVMRSNLRLFSGDVTGALLDTERAVALNPSYPAAFTARGRALLARKEVAAAQADFDRVLKRWPKKADHWAQRAIFLHLERGQAGRAIKDLKQAVKLARTEEYANYYRVLLIATLIRAGRVAEAQKILADTVVVKTPRLGANTSAFLLLRGTLTEAAYRTAVPFTQVRREYLEFVQGLRAELGGHRAVALMRYQAAARAPRWHTLWCPLVWRCKRALAPAAPAKGGQPVKPKRR